MLAILLAESAHKVNLGLFSIETAISGQMGSLQFAVFFYPPHGSPVVRVAYLGLSRTISGESWVGSIKEVIRKTWEM